MLVFYVKSYVFNDFFGSCIVCFLVKLRSFCLISNIVLLCTKLGLLGCTLKGFCFEIWFVYFGFGLCFVLYT
uniref:Uncharacterized protein n=1 Tax=Populus trichocarpa TaxID=3694 RepID=A0A3N7ED59_POPTR